MKQMRIGKGIICLAAVMMLVMMPLCACRAETEDIEDIQPANVNMTLVSYDLLDEYCGAEHSFELNEESAKRIYLQEYPCRSFCADNNSRIYILSGGAGENISIDCLDIDQESFTHIITFPMPPVNESEFYWDTTQKEGIVSISEIIGTDENGLWCFDETEGSFCRLDLDSKTWTDFVKITVDEYIESDLIKSTSGNHVIIDPFFVNDTILYHALVSSSYRQLTYGLFCTNLRTGETLMVDKFIGSALCYVKDSELYAISKDGVQVYSFDETQFKLKDKYVMDSKDADLPFCYFLRMGQRCCVIDCDSGYIYELIDNENDQLQVSDPLTRISSKDLDYHVFGLSNTSAAVVYESMDEEKMWIEIIEVPTEHT